MRSSALMVLGVASLCACRREPDAHTKPPAATGTDETSWTAPETVPPAFDAAALGAGLDAAIGVAWEIEPSPVFALYTEAMSYTDGYCPYSYGYSTTYGGIADSWYAQCDSERGATYSGYAYYYLYDDYDRYESLYLLATVVTPDGEVLTAEGGFESGVSTYGNTVYTYVSLDGFAEFDGPVDGWLAQGIRPAVYIERNERLNGSWREVYADGQLAGLPSAEVDTVDFVETHLDAGNNCPEPSGSISLRSAAGDWFDVTFEGDAGSCDGCGEARWRGIVMGEVCGDFGPWMTGEVL